MFRRAGEHAAEAAGVGKRARSAAQFSAAQDGLPLQNRFRAKSRPYGSHQPRRPPENSAHAIVRNASSYVSLSLSGKRYLASGHSLGTQTSGERHSESATPQRSKWTLSALEWASAMPWHTLAHVHDEVQGSAHSYYSSRPVREYSRTDFRPRRNSTSVGDMRGFSSECPSRPYSGDPHVYTSPLSDST